MGQDVLSSFGNMFTGAENAIGGAFNSGANALGGMFGAGPSAYDSAAAGGAMTGSAPDAAGVAKALGGTQMPAALNQGLTAAQGNLGAMPQVGGAGGGGAAGGVGGLSTAGADTILGGTAGADTILGGSAPSGSPVSTGFNIGPTTDYAGLTGSPTLTPTSATPPGSSTVTPDTGITTPLATSTWQGAGNDMASLSPTAAPDMASLRPIAAPDMASLSPTAAPGAATGAAKPDMMNSMAKYLMNPKNIPQELSTALTGVNLFNAMQPNPLEKQMKQQLNNAESQQALYQNRVAADQAGGVSPAQQAALDLERQQARARILSQPGGILSAQNADLSAVDTAINKQQFDEAQANLAQDAKLMDTYDTNTQNYLSNLLKLEAAQSGQFNQSLAQLFQALGIGNPANYGKQPNG